MEQPQFRSPGGYVNVKDSQKSMTKTRTVFYPIDAKFILPKGDVRMVLLF